MPNGWHQNYERLCMLLEAFYQEFGHWPCAVRLAPIVQKSLRSDFDERGFQLLNERVEILPGDPEDEDLTLVATDAEGRSLEYGRRVVEPKHRLPERAAEWLGVESHLL